MINKWKRERPSENGWYFWRRMRTIKDPAKWSIYYIETTVVYTPKGKEMALDIYESGMLSFPQNGGWWWGPIHTPKD